MFSFIQRHSYLAVLTGKLVILLLFFIPAAVPVLGFEGDRYEPASQVRDADHPGLLRMLEAHLHRAGHPGGV
jgi:hypothetical protein